MVDQHQVRQRQPREVDDGLNQGYQNVRMSSKWRKMSAKFLHTFCLTSCHAKQDRKDSSLFHTTRILFEESSYDIIHTSYFRPFRYYAFKGLHMYLWNTPFTKFLNNHELVQNFTPA
jgi:hypothetical protein